MNIGYLAGAIIWQLTFLPVFGQGSYDHQATLDTLHGFKRFNSTTMGYPNKYFKDEDKVFHRLLQGASRQQIAALLEDPHPITRAFGYEAIYCRFPDEFLTVALRGLNDEGQVESRIQLAPLGAILWDCLRNMTGPGGIADDPETYATIIRAALELGKPEGRLIIMLATTKFHPQYADQIRTLAHKRTLDSALVALARYQDPQDIPLLLQSLNPSADGPYRPLNFPLMAVYRFPHEAFFPSLVDLFHQGLAKPFKESFNMPFNALTEYRREETKALFKKIVRRARNDAEIAEHHLPSLFKAITQNPKALAYHVDLILQLNRDWRFLNVEALNFFARHDIPACQQMLADMDDQLPTLNNCVAKANASALPLLLGKLETLADSNSIPALLKRLSEAKEPHIYVPILASLSSYDPKVTGRELKALKRDQYSDWSKEKKKAVKMALRKVRQAS